MHATDGLDKFGRGDVLTGSKSIKPLRHPEGLQSHICTAITITKLVGCMILERWGSDPQRSKAQIDYNADILPVLRQLQGEDLIKVAWR
jgi:hypothetical protein